MQVPRHEAGVEDDAEAISKFFSKTCAGRTADNGPRNTADGKGALWEPMCSACKVGRVVGGVWQRIDAASCCDSIYDAPWAGDNHNNESFFQWLCLSRNKAVQTGSLPLPFCYYTRT